MRSYKAPLLVFIFASAFIIFSVIYTQPPKKIPSSIPSSAVVLTEDYDESPAGLERFWNDELYHLITEELIKGKHRIPVINVHYKVASSLVREKYGNDLHVRMTQSVNPKSDQILFGCLIERNKANLEIVVPAILRIYKHLRQNGGPSWKEHFQFMIVIGCLHELDHIAYDFCTPQEQAYDHEKMVIHEIGAWAVTVEEVIRPLIEVHKVSLGESETVYYRAWVAAGYDRFNPKWEAFIRSSYSIVRKH